MRRTRTGRVRALSAARTPGTARVPRTVRLALAAASALLLTAAAVPGSSAPAGGTATGTAAPAGMAPSGTAARDETREGESVLVFSKTAGFRHDSIPDGIEALRQLGAENGFSVDATEDASVFTPEGLAGYDAVVFLSTTGDVLDDSQQAAFEGYIEGGGGFAGIHAAADTEYDWPWYGGLVGAWFDSHPAIQPATVEVEDHAHPATAHLGGTWERTDEWYNYRANPREDTHVLAALDEDSYDGGTMDGDHPIAWCHEYEGGRVFYTGGGHTGESYADADFRAHLLGGVRWATGAAQADCRPEKGYSDLYGNGTGLEEWQQAGPGRFEERADGTLRTVGGMGLLWHQTERTGDYSLKLDWRMDGDDNSGVFVGFPASDDPWSAVDNGYEIQIDASDVPEKTTGSVYGFQSADLAARDAALNPPGEWNTYEIRVEGERLQIFLNGTRINDFTNTDPARSLADGHIGLQNHGDGDDVDFRDIRLRELTPGTARSAARGGGS
ncbi:type 1 glutamine amidotransferase [Streptomyces sp. Amel2xB2]|uniref:ThuA domain-containing protein n=1 Tax=Streptomyces sp. Amel2xB2 TaxID=1305829 RepID=UPI000DB9E76A|nr:ThuA domain-containing protein [Streptomyces sp. Amel2xB2]RAJ69125.1 type 1 glutamine amidotransferase [Streptomyces sp. Amel2xB2]